MDDVSRLTGRARGAPGFTLSELTVAMAVGSLVLSLSMAALMDMSRHLGRMEQESGANDESKLLNDYISTGMLSVGGGMLRPWMSLAVENGWDENGSDRITFATLQDLTLQCAIDRVEGDLVFVADELDDCCLTDAFRGQQVILATGQPDASSHWASHRVRTVNENLCYARLGEGLGEVLDVPPDDEAAWSEGFLAVVSLRTLWVDHSRDALMVSEDTDLDGEAEDRVLADRVLDLQASLGYDVSPWDWQVTDRGDTSDEWLYNAAGDTVSAEDGQGLELAEASDLRMIKVGVVVGAPVRSDPDSDPIRVLDGPERSRYAWVLRPFLSTTGLRNYDIMR